MLNGLANAVTGHSPRSERRTRIRRRVGSASAAKIAVTLFCLLATGLTIVAGARQSQGIVSRQAKYRGEVVPGALRPVEALGYGFDERGAAFPWPSSG